MKNDSTIALLGKEIEMERLIPEIECAQGRCMMTTTGCWGRCQAMPPRLPVYVLEEPQTLNLAFLPFDVLAGELRRRGAKVTPAPDGDSSSTNMPNA